MRVVFRDATACPRILPFLWGLGAKIDRTRHSYRVRDWPHLALYLEHLADEPVTEIHLWSHGTRRGPLIGPHLPTEQQLDRIFAAAPKLKRVWWRSCSVGQNLDFVRSITDRGVTRCSTAP